MTQEETRTIDEKMLLFQLLGHLNNFSLAFKDLSDREREELEKAFDDENGLGKWRSERLWCNYVDLDPWTRIAGALDALSDVLGRNRISSAIGEFRRSEDISVLVLLEEQGIQLLSTTKIELKQGLNDDLKREWKDILVGKHPSQ